MKRINCVVADDEPIARQGIREFIDRLDFLHFSGFAKDVDSTTDLLQRKEVDLLFMDIEMPGMSGIEFIRTCTERMPLVVFITAYPDYAVESYNLNVFDYLLKPASFERFSTSAKRAFDAINIRSAVREKKDFFFLRCEGRFEKIKSSEIVYISAMQNYVRIHFSSGRVMIVHSALKSVFRMLDEEKFVPVHKSYIVNLDYVDSVTGNSINLAQHGQVPIGRHFRPALIPRLFAGS